MKTIGGIITVILLTLLMVSGLSLIFTQAGSSGNLDIDSLNLISQYDTQLQNFTGEFDDNYDTAKANQDYEPNNNLIGDEIKEYFEHKSRVDQLRDTMSMAYKLPDMLFLAIPFVDYDDLTIYRNVTWFLVWLGIFIAIVLALRNGKITEEQ